MRIPSAVALVAVIVCATGGAEVSVPTASAALSSCGTPGNKFDGAWATGITQYGAKASVETLSPQLCNPVNGSTSLSAAWVMETTNATCDGWAQAGYVHTGSNSAFGYHWNVFTQTVTHSTVCGGTPNTEWFGTPSGSPTFKVYYTTDHLGGAGFFDLYQGSTYLWSTSWDPASAWTGNWVPEFFGETGDCNSDMPGTQSNKVTFGSVEKMENPQAGGEGTWSAINDLILPAADCTRFHRGWQTQPDAFNIWTDPLS
jgi:hypothetical protein